MSRKIETFLIQSKQPQSAQILLKGTRKAVTKSLVEMFTIEPATSELVESLKGQGVAVEEVK